MIKVHFRKILQKNSETARTMNVRKSGTTNQKQKKKKKIALKLRTIQGPK